MKISEVISTIKLEIVLGRTPCGRPINDYSVDALKATIEDKKNYNQNAVGCRNCCIIISSLLVTDGCPNCGGHDLDINKGEMI